MEFSLEELQTTLEEMGFKDVPSDHLHLFAKDLKRLMRHERHMQKKRPKMTSDSPTLSYRSTETIPTNSTTTATSYMDHCQQPQETASTKEDKKLTKSVKLPVAGPSQTELKTSVSTELQKTNFPTKTTVKKDDAAWKKLKTDPVKLYSWYKTHWDVYGLK